MAKFKVNKVFRNKETKEVYKVGDIVELTVKRANEINSNSKNDQEMVTRVDKDKE